MSKGEVAGREWVWAERVRRKEHEWRARRSWGAEGEGEGEGDAEGGAEGEEEDGDDYKNTGSHSYQQGI